MKNVRGLGRQTLNVLSVSVNGPLSLTWECGTGPGKQGCFSQNLLISIRLNDPDWVGTGENIGRKALSSVRLVFDIRRRHALRDVGCSKMRPAVWIYWRAVSIQIIIFNFKSVMRIGSISAAFSSPVYVPPRRS